MCHSIRSLTAVLPFLLLLSGCSGRPTAPVVSTAPTEIILISDEASQAPVPTAAPTKEPEWDEAAIWQALSELVFEFSSGVGGWGTELYIDSVAYLTRDQYRADKKLTKEERLKRAGYTDADIDRLKQKHGVPQLTDAIRQRIEDQRDWDEEYELWKATQGGGSTNDFEGLD